jgi:FixJ family two-component response regulator
MSATDSPEQQPTVFVVDDEEPMRNALQRALSRHGLTVHTFTSGPEFLERYRPTPSACLLLDMKMPEMTGLELQAILNERRVELPVIFLTGAGDVPSAVIAMKAGAADFLEKPFDNETLTARIRQCIAAHARRHLASPDGERYERGIGQLTPREAEVLQLMLTGNTNKMIGKTLGVSHRTVDVHRSRVMEKMRAETLAELVRMELSWRTSQH